MIIPPDSFDHHDATGTARTVEPFGPVLRTPDHRFGTLAGFDHTPRYLDDLPGFEGLRLHYVDTGYEDPGRMRPTIVCLHGQRGWAYLFRKIIGPLRDRGFRVVAPDLFGFGRSDKPMRDEAYSFTFHRQTILAFFQRMAFGPIMAIGHDWGAWFAASLPLALRDQIEGIAMVNGTIRSAEDPLWRGFHTWRSFHNAEQDPAVGRHIAFETGGLAPEEIAAYDAPFPTARHKAAIRRFPNLVPTLPGQDGDALSRAALSCLEKDWPGQLVLVAGAKDRVFGPRGPQSLAGRLPNAHVLSIEEAGPFALEIGDRFIGSVLDQLTGAVRRASSGPVEQTSAPRV
ncbi:MAG: alpha/beta fold hydrolase [Alphaproteobacteria bacterium]